MKWVEESVERFINELGSKNAVPGGGGAAALLGGVGVALAGMVANLSATKKKTEEQKNRIAALLEESKKLQERFLELTDLDAENFLPLSKAYGLPTDTEEQKEQKEKVLEEALKKACEVPVETVVICHKAIDIHHELVHLSSKLVISDVGVGVQALRAGLLSAKLNVDINLKLIKDENFIGETRQKIDSLIPDGLKKADDVFEIVESAINK
ncbi:Formiminotetrahydrofolate cyclodeaminase [Tindallia magadiensis]|uniref:Formiminotetrahydrofolate cyclodeaminase n=1 Tax=Tindallia magadiensis TaxID=69895 RepID=A0A1I3C1K4_9FIRM|nr:cyclodeaminase/cyclohydrolase family protein [Tindallia magadiensis]SFH68196.1 Formiminotetrahydrofolate cyclodeaminase [Tindallia magadiensis]